VCWVQFPLGCRSPLCYWCGQGQPEPRLEVSSRLDILRIWVGIHMVLYKKSKFCGGGPRQKPLLFCTKSFLCPPIYAKNPAVRTLSSEAQSAPAHTSNTRGSDNQVEPAPNTHVRPLKRPGIGSQFRKNMAWAHAKNFCFFVQNHVYAHPYTQKIWP
jgi:hypothetical protein